MAIQTTSVLKRSSLFRVGELTDGTSPYDSKALEYMNQIYRSLLAGGNEFDLELGCPWIWARSQAPGTFVLKPKLIGNVAITQGSSTITFTAPITTSVQGQWIAFDGRPEYFRIVSHVAGASTAVIDTTYTDDSSANNGYEIFFLEYDLPVQIERLIAPMTVTKQQKFDAAQDGQIYQVDLANINTNFPMKILQEEIPQQFAQISRDPFGNVRVRMNSSVVANTRVSFDYIPIYPALYEAILDTSVYINTATNTITTPTPHGLTDGTKIVFDVINSASLPSGLAVETIYYVINSTASTLKVSISLGGSAVSLGSTGSGTIVFSNIPIIPQSLSNVLDYGVSAYLMVDKNDDRSTAFSVLTKSKMAAMIAANNRELSQSAGGRVGQAIPRLDMYTGPKRFWRQNRSLT